MCRLKDFLILSHSRTTERVSPRHQLEHRRIETARYAFIHGDQPLALKIGKRAFHCLVTEFGHGNLAWTKRPCEFPIAQYRGHHSYKTALTVSSASPQEKQGLKRKRCQTQRAETEQ